MLNQLAAMVRGELKELERNVLCALITISVHSRDIITGLVQSKCDSRYVPILGHSSCARRTEKLLAKL